MWGDESMEVVPLQPREVVCPGCRLVYHSGNESCTNCQLWGDPVINLEQAFYLDMAAA